MPVTEATYRRVALEDPESKWELLNGQLREKPGMSYDHNYVMTYLGIELGRQLDQTAFEVRVNAGRLRRTDQSCLIPDVFVFEASTGADLRGRADILEIYDSPPLLVVEVWSPSTGQYDVDRKFAEYRRRGDREIWRLHPFERTLIAWRRQPDGEYAESIQRGGTAQPIALPGVTIDLAALFR